MQPVVKIAMANSASTSLVGIYIALERGYFREEGLDVEFINSITPADQIAQLATGRLQIGFGGPEPGLFNAIGRGIDIKLIAPLAGYDRGNAAVAFVVRKDLIDSGRYKEFKDLKGMNVAMITPTSAQYYFHLLLRKGGLDISDVNPVYMGYPDMAVAMASKRIDAAEVAEPTVSRIEAAGIGKIILPLGSLTPGIRPLSLLVSPIFAKENPEAVRRFIVAFTRGKLDFWHAFMKKDRPDDQADVIRALTKYTPLSDPNVYREIFARHGVVEVDPYATVDRQSLDDSQRYYLKQGTQLQYVEVSKIVDDSYLRFALDRLKRL